MSGGSVCIFDDERKGPACAIIGGSKAASGFPEGNDAPLVLHDAKAPGSAIVLSPYDKFGQQRSISQDDLLGWGPDLALAPAASALPTNCEPAILLLLPCRAIPRTMQFARTSCMCGL